MSKKKYKNVTIFLDLDGVIADFETHAQNGQKYDDRGHLIRDELDTDWWQTIPAFDGAHDFYKTLRTKAAVKFLTAPMLNSDCHKGKADWVQSFASKQGKWAINDLIICPSRDKYFLAGPDRILIDDRISNIRDWEAAGGIGILHEGDFAKTLAQLDLALNTKPHAPGSLPKPPRP